MVENRGIQYIDRLLAAMDQGYREVASRHPKELTGLTEGQRLVSALHVGCLDFYRGTWLLLGANPPLTEEAFVLTRSLIHDSTTLAYMHKHADRLEELALRFLFGSLQEEIELEEYAINVGFPAQPVLDRLRAELEELRQQAVAAGITEVRRLPPLRQMLEDMGKEMRYWTFKRASHGVHTSRVSISTRMKMSGPREWRVSPERPMSHIVHIGLIATNAFFWAYAACSLLLGWQTADDITTVTQEIDMKFAQLLKDAGLDNPNRIDNR